MIDALNREELKRRAKGMPVEEQAIMIRQFDSKVIAEEYQARLEDKENLEKEIISVFVRHRRE